MRFVRLSRVSEVEVARMEEHSSLVSQLSPKIEYFAKLYRAVRMDGMLETPEGRVKVVLTRKRSDGLNSILRQAANMPDCCVKHELEALRELSAKIARIEGLYAIDKIRSDTPQHALRPVRAAASNGSAGQSAGIKAKAPEPVTDADREGRVKRKRMPRDTQEQSLPLIEARRDEGSNAVQGRRPNIERYSEIIELARGGKTIRKNELVAAFERAGFEIRYGRGSHINITDPDTKRASGFSYSKPGSDANPAFIKNMLRAYGIKTTGSS